MMCALTPTSCTNKPLVSTIPQVATALQVVLTTVATTVAGSTGFIRRQRHLTGAGFVQAVVFGFLAHPGSVNFVTGLQT